MKEKRNRILSGWLVMVTGCFAFLFILLILASFVQPALATAAAAADTTVTPTPTQASSGPTSGALAVSSDGFDAWCAPLAYARTKPTGPDAPVYARKLNKDKGTFKITIPASYCVLSFKLTQPVPDGAVLTFYDAKYPFLRLPLQKADSNPNIGWAVVKHTWVINPPKWSVSYNLGLTGPNKEDLWSNKVSFKKDFQMCRFGVTPDPVTLWCLPYDKWETEPQHPDAVWHFTRTP